MKTMEIPAAAIKEAQAKLDRITPSTTAYADLLASFAWKPIGTYDKAAAPVVLLRCGEQVCAGLWSEATIWPGWDDSPEAAWRSAEEATLEMPLRFEPDEFAIVDSGTLHGFIVT